jgi:hypothetical protein
MALYAGLTKPFAASPAARRRSVAAFSNSQHVMLPAVKATADFRAVNVPAAVSAFAASVVSPKQSCALADNQRENEQQLLVK